MKKIIEFTIIESLAMGIAFGIVYMADYAHLILPFYSAPLTVLGHIFIGGVLYTFISLFLNQFAPSEIAIQRSVEEQKIANAEERALEDMEERRIQRENFEKYFGEINKKIGELFSEKYELVGEYRIYIISDEKIRIYHQSISTGLDDPVLPKRLISHSYPGSERISFPLVVEFRAKITGKGSIVSYKNETAYIEENHDVHL